MTDDDGGLFARLARPAARRRPRRRRRRQPVDVPAVLPGGARRRSSASAASARPTRRGSRTSAAGSTPARRPSTSSARSSLGDHDGSRRAAVHRLGPLERHQLRRPQGGGRRSPRRCTSRRRRPGSRGSGCPTTSATGSPTSASCSTSEPWPPTITDYDGPLGGARAASSRGGASPSPSTRPGASASSGRTPSCSSSTATALRRRSPTCIDDDDGLEVLGGRPSDAAADVGVARRSRPGRSDGAAPTPARWSDGAPSSADAWNGCSRTRCRVRPNQVYLADGVARRFGVVGDGGSTGTPGCRQRRRSLRLDRPAGSRAAPRCPPRSTCPATDRPKVLVLDTGLRTLDGPAPEHPDLDNCVVHDPWRDRWRPRAAGRRGRARRRRAGTLDFQAGHGTFISGIIRQLLPGRRDPPPRRADELRRRRRRLGASPPSSGPCAALGDGIDVVVMAFGSYVDERRRRRRWPAPRRAARRQPSRSPRPATTARRRPYFPAALPDVDRRRRRSTPTGGRRSATSGRGSTPARPASTSSARSSPTSTSAARRRVAPTATAAGRAGAARASPPRRSPRLIAQERTSTAARPATPGSGSSPPPALRLPDLGVVFNV